MMDWPYYELRDGYLYDEDGCKLRGTPCFPDWQDADDWLVDNDVRGTLRQPRVDSWMAI